MITSVDTSILLDILTASPQFLESSLSLFKKALQEGQLIVCPVVWGELRPFFNSDQQMIETMEKMELNYDDFNQESASLAGALWKKYCDKGGKKTRILADFLIGAHAKIKAKRLLTRDRGFYRSYFTGLALLTNE